MQTVKNYTIKQRIPTKVWFILFVVGFLVIFAYFTQPWFATPINGILALMVAAFVGFSVWLVTPQFLVGVVLASIIIGVIVARKYIWGTKVKAVVATQQPALQQGLQSTANTMYSSQTAGNQDLIVEEDK
jgi:membrane-bound ClpP family serine protease